MRVALLLIMFVTCLTITAQGASAASQTSFKGASSAVQNAFVAVQTAGNDGGNITSLVSQLNGAIGLIQKASYENSSSPAQASTDLQSAFAIARQVQSSAATVAQQGISARKLQITLSIASAVVILCVAVALYAYGDRIYRRLWLRMYRGEVVKKVG